MTCQRSLKLKRKLTRRDVRLLPDVTSQVAGCAECNQILGPVVFRDAVMVMHSQSDFGPFGFSQTRAVVTGAEAVAMAFGTTPSGLFFDSERDSRPVFGIS